eukprot:CAMPEP_0172763504 /NCGR_PEP_ID=MMETSP1074-20121228/175466_1 /TAXON_ID=2916 /ORGANISM="Ceratium fusus, Strain PA161109" /LENGTH=90 /DNA_ID=CAMNT_0013598097 /DNA_START=40 /DNA_END=308 /DNA_ORIENTATION=+
MVVDLEQAVVVTRSVARVAQRCRPHQEAPEPQWWHSVLALVEPRKRPMGHWGQTSQTNGSRHRLVRKSRLHVARSPASPGPQHGTVAATD